MNVSSQLLSLFQNFQQHRNLYDAGLTDNKLNDSVVISNAHTNESIHHKICIVLYFDFGTNMYLHSSLNDIQFRPVSDKTYSLTAASDDLSSLYQARGYKTFYMLNSTAHKN